MGPLTAPSPRNPGGQGAEAQNLAAIVSNDCGQAKKILGDGRRFLSGLKPPSGVLRAVCQPYFPWIETSSTSKIKVAFGGITLPAPRSP
jgi:hypothetical protein